MYKNLCVDNGKQEIKTGNTNIKSGRLKCRKYIDSIESFSALAFAFLTLARSKPNLFFDSVFLTLMLPNSFHVK